MTLIVHEQPYRGCAPGEAGRRPQHAMLHLPLRSAVFRRLRGLVHHNRPGALVLVALLVDPSGSGNDFALALPFSPQLKAGLAAFLRRNL